MKKQSLKFSKILISIMISFCLLLSLTGCAGAKGDVGGALGGVFHSGIYENCSKGTSSSSTGEETDADEIENVKKIYSVFKGKLGWNDYMIAGMCGNLQAEAHLQPKRLEADTSLHPDYDKFLEEHDSYTEQVLAIYRVKGPKVSESAYDGSDGKYCGVGMVQWTGPRAEKIVKGAEEIGEKWYTLEVQIAFILYEVQNTRPAYNGEPTSATDAALEFAKNYEGNTALAQSERATNAEGLMSTISSCSVDTAYADKIFEYAQKFGETKEGSGSGSSSSSSKKCSAGTKSGGNASIAEAAITWCYDASTMEDTSHQDCGQGDGGHPALNKYRDFMLKMNCHNPGWICECSGFSEAVVKWSGADDSFSGASGGQISHANGSDHWENLGSGHSSSDLQPGDVLADANHVFVWVGSEAIQEKRPGAKDPYGGTSPNVCEASLGGHAPYFSTYTDDRLKQYEVLRNVKQEDSSKYKEIQDF